MINNFKKIAFFGASVTRQKQSYADYLMSILKIDYKKFGHGSMHLDDAGICFIDEIIAYCPDICFIDWFSTSKTEYGDELYTYLNTITCKLLEQNIEPFFLLFPISKMLPYRLEMYDNIEKYAKNYNINCINVYKKMNKNIHIEEVIKDYVHTTDFGAQYYASTISDYMIKELLISDRDVYPSKNKYTTIRKTPLNVIINKFISINVEDEIIGIYQTIGPHSNSVEIYKDGVFLEKQNVWDVWCYYERETFKIKIRQPGDYLIRVSNCRLDKSNCKEQKEWDSFKNALWIKEIYHTSKITIKEYE